VCASAASATYTTKSAAGIVDMCATTTTTAPVQNFSSDITGSTCATTVGTGHFSVHVVGCIARCASTTTTTTHVIIATVVVITNSATTWESLASNAGAAW
jgi:hypothetical protein